MSHTNAKKTISITRWVPLGMVLAVLLFTVTAHAAAPGIKGTTFNLEASTAYISQPDGALVYSWGYGCADTTGVTFVPNNPTMANAACPTMQIPGPTLVVTEGDTVKITLTNNLPAAAGNTSMLFPGFQVGVSGGVAGLLTQEAQHGGSVTYTFTATTPGTHAYYSGTQGDLQVEMGLYGALIVLPKNPPSACTATGTLAAKNLQAEAAHGESDWRLAPAAYNSPEACYDREYLFQFSEMDPVIHSQALDQVTAAGDCTPGAMGCSLQVATEPYHPAYFMINGRSMPDLMDPNYANEYPHQPYNGDPHMHPGELVLVRVIGTGRWQHPFHEHGNHLRTLARDGNLIVSSSNIPGTTTQALAGPLLFTTTSTPGLTYDGIFYWTGKGLNWDVYAHNANNDPGCHPDANGYDTTNPSAINYYEWCEDHNGLVNGVQNVNKALETHPFGDVGSGGPVTLPDPNILTNGAWFGGSPYLGPNATTRSTYGTCTGSNCSTTGTTPPSGTIANPPSTEAGFAFMWHSHNERELTTNNIFPGGMMMMMLVDSREFKIDETN